MNVKKPKIKIGHNLRVPKRKKVRINPLGVKKKRLSKNYGNAKTMQKMRKRNNKKTHTKKNSHIKDQIKSEKQIQQKNSEELKRNIKKLQTLLISLSGLDELTETSIKQIQQKRLKICRDNEKILGKINASAKKLTQYESKYRDSN
ncbi:hypothetical protein [Nitrosopumilus sp.]|uniref:hypothetical protein n=1 Tax=Nitrosopumilus sp. TaxID=2024843 RepID=UPI003B5CE8B0